jgi:hypothetical protein
LVTVGIHAIDIVFKPTISLRVNYKINSTYIMMKPVGVIIKDETFGGKILNEIAISLASERVTVRDVIIARVYAEVEAYNKTQPEYFNSLVKPSEAEATLNGYKLKSRKIIDPEKQAYIALDAFTKNGFFMLVDKKQALSLDEELIVSTHTQISFFKLTQLVGG